MTEFFINFLPYLIETPCQTDGHLERFEHNGGVESCTRCHGYRSRDRRHPHHARVVLLCVGGAEASIVAPTDTTAKLL
jgi:hypothetical protein